MLDAFAYFSPETIKLLTHSVNPAVLGVIVTFVVNVAVFFKRFTHKHHRIAILVVTALVIFVPTFVIFNRVNTLRSINETSEVDITQLDEWNKLLAYFENEEGDDVFEDAHETEEIDEEIREHTTYVNLEEGVKSGDYKVVDILCSQNPVKVADQRCKLSFEIYSNLGDKEKVEAIMTAYGYSKETPLLIYCEAGFTTSRIAFILTAYGYNVAWGALGDITDFSLIDTDFEPKVNTEILVDELNYQPNGSYAYFLFNYDDQNPFYYDSFYSDNRTQAQRYSNFAFYQGNENFDNALFEEIGLAKNIKPGESATKESLEGKQVACRNSLHCYLTRQYLGYLEINTVNEVYCIDCSTEDNE